MAKSFIASGDVYQLLASPDGVKWLSSIPNDLAILTNNDSFFSTCGNSTFALATTSTADGIVRSTDGALWTGVTIPALRAYYEVACSDTLSVAFGISGSSTPRVATSP